MKKVYDRASDKKLELMSQAAVMAALTAALTLWLHIPAGLNGGYIHFGDAMIYLAAVHPVYGKKAFASMLQFAQDCKRILEDVRFTVVDIIGREKVEESRRLAQRLGIPLRVREYSE